MNKHIAFITAIRDFDASICPDQNEIPKGFDFTKNKFTMKINSDSADQNSFTVGIDDFLSQTQNILNERDNKPLNSDDICASNTFAHSIDAFQEIFKNHSADIICQNFHECLDTSSLSYLQKELLTESDDTILQSFRSFEQNKLGTNFHFEVLNGEFNEAISTVLISGSKEFSLETDHRRPNKKNLQKCKSKNFKKRLEDQETQKSNCEQEIGKLLDKWEEIIVQNTDKIENPVLSTENLPEIIKYSETLFNVLTLTELISSEKPKDIKNENHYNNLWNLLSDHFKKFQENKDNIDSQKNLLAAATDTFEEFDGIELEDNIAYISQKDIKDQENETNLQSKFEKILEEPGAKIKVHNQPNKKDQILKAVTQYEWAVQDNTDLSNFYNILPKNKFAISFPFELDDFQKRAVLHLENKESVFVAAHTSAGKTVVAEYAIALSKKHMTRTIYTSPIKALSNQKYRDFSAKFDSGTRVGILTGDVTLKPESNCLIVTTEILRSMLYKGSGFTKIDTIRDIEWVIFDEVHYVNDIERGVVWEETIIMLPDHIGIIMLSATVPNAMDFANWVGRTKRRKIFVQTTYKRPTPLEHSIYLGGDFKVIKSKDGEFLQHDYERFLQQIAKSKKNQDEFREKRKEELREKFDENDWEFKDKKKKKFLQRENLKKEQKKFNNPSDSKDSKLNKEKNQFYELIRHCSQRNLLPCVFFAFSKKKCMELAFGLVGLDLCTREERNKITVFYNNSLKRLKPVDRELPQLIKLGELLKKGIAVHHGDLLPIAKEIVEILFSDGLIKVLFATETFAMGINMPAKTVIFCGLRKNDGKEFRYLKSNEYTQMSGRAGRRGLDDKGNVILFVKDKLELPPTYDLKKIIDQKGELLESKFRLTYGTIFNLLLAKEINVVDVMQRSFIQHGKIASLPSQQKKLKALKKQIELIQKNLECKVRPLEKEFPMTSYWQLVEKMRDLAGELWNHPFFGQNFGFPKFAIIMGRNAEFDVGLIINSQKINDKNVFRTFCIDNQTQNKKKRIEISYEEDYKSNLRNGNDSINGVTYKIYDLNASNIIQIIDNGSRGGKIEGELTYKQKENLVEALSKEKDKQMKSKQDNLFLAFNIGSSLNEDPKIIELYKEIQQIKEQIMNHDCHGCDIKPSHLDTIQRIKSIQSDVNAFSQDQNEDTLAFGDEFESRTKILQKLIYLDENQMPLIKARVGRELGSSDIFLCEVIMDNVLDDLAPEEVAALLSGFICQTKNSEVNFNELLPDRLKEAMDRVQQICTKIIELEVLYNVTVEDEEDYLKEKINFSLVKVVYEWACQKNFSEICELTDVQEGSIVRTILRLEILLRDMRNACKAMGNKKLHDHLEEASHLIRRDIVFAGSLYLE